MPVDVRWDNPEKTIIRHTYKGNWTHDEYLQSVHTTYDLINEVDHVVHLMVIVKEGVRPLSDMISAARDTRVIRHGRQGITVVVGASSLMVLLTRVISAVMPTARSVRFVNDEADAYAIFKDAPATNGKSR